MARAILPAALLLVVAAACEMSKPPPPPLTPELVTERWLPGIVSGRSTLASVTAALGAPVSFEGGRVGVWRLFLVPDETPLDAAARDRALDGIESVYANPYDPYRPVNLAGIEERIEQILDHGALVPADAAPPPGAAAFVLTRDAQFDLTLVFGPDGALLRHSLVRIGP